MFGISAAIKAIVALIIVVVIAVTGWYITGLRADLAVSQNNEKVLTQGIEDQKAVLAQMKVDIGKIQSANSAMNSTIQRQAADMASLTNKFNQDRQGNPRDFGQFAAASPELVERLVNRATKNVYRCLELVSGAQHTPEELNAKTSKEINRECTAIANPNYKPSSDVQAVVSDTAKPVPAASEIVQPAVKEPVKPQPAGTKPPPPILPLPPNKGVK